MKDETRVNPGMVLVARESRGWTQGNLADAIGASQAEVSKFEVGIREVNQETADAIARALNYDVNLLYQQDVIYALGSTSVFHRKRSALGIREQRRIQAETNIRRLQVAGLLRSVSLSYDRAFVSMPADEFGGDVALIARRVRERWKVPEGPILDLTALVEGAGGIVLLVDFGTNLIDGLHIWLPALPPIFMMNRNVPGERHRFSLAHELGHAILHHSSDFEEVEEQANGFAAEFLLPRSHARSDLRNFSLEAAARLKPVWKVSMQALIMRAFQLRQISESTRRRLFMHLGARGQRMVEPWPLPIEEPRTFKGLVDFHRNELGYTDEDMRALLFSQQLGPIERPAGKNPKLKLVDDESS